MLNYYELITIKRENVPKKSGMSSSYYIFKQMVLGKYIDIVINRGDPINFYWNLGIERCGSLIDVCTLNLKS